MNPTATTEATNVARHGGKRLGAGRPKGERDDVPIKMDRQKAAKVRFIAESRGIPAAEYLDSFGAAIDRDFAKASKGD